MNELKFNSQVCTSIEQSQRLLNLGLKPETADMVLIKELAYDAVAHCTYDADTYMIRPIDYLEGERHRGHITAWSLHRLIDLCGAERMPISFYKKGKVMIRVNHVHPTHNGRSNYNHYDSLIDCIEWLISEGYFNKEYLNQ